MLILRYAVFLLYLLAGLLAGTNLYWNEFRASTGCGSEYSWVFSRSDTIGGALTLFGVIALLGFIQFIVSRTRLILVLNTSLGIAFLCLCTYFLLDDFTTHYAPCDRKGDQTSFFLFGLTIIGGGIWSIFTVFMLALSALLHDYRQGVQQKNNGVRESA